MPPQGIAVSLLILTMGCAGCRVKILTALVLIESLVIAKDKFLVTYGNAHVTL